MASTRGAGNLCFQTNYSTWIRIQFFLKYSSNCSTITTAMTCKAVSTRISQYNNYWNAWDNNWLYMLTHMLYDISNYPAVEINTRILLLDMPPNMFTSRTYSYALQLSRDLRCVSSQPCVTHPCNWNIECVGPRTLVAVPHAFACGHERIHKSMSMAFNGRWSPLSRSFNWTVRHVHSCGLDDSINVCWASSLHCVSLMPPTRECGNVDSSAARVGSWRSDLPSMWFDL